MGITRRAFLRLAAVAGAGAALGITGCRSQAPGATTGAATDGPPYQRSFFCFDTLCCVSGIASKQALQQAVDRCLFFEQTLSARREDSDVWRINTANGGKVRVQPETADLIRKSLHYSEVSGGLFDITIGTVSLLWDFHEGVVPADADITAALAHIGYRGVMVEGDTVQLADPLARIDLGGIAKGYIADDLARLLAEAGEESACINLGGNVKVIGSKADGNPWTIGVRDAQAGSSKIVATVSSTGGSLVTSGLYERRFERGGRSYWHILDPRTGYPAESAIVSASVYAQESLDGDGLTKPLFMLGEEEALAFLEDQGAQGLLLDAGGGMATTPDSPFELR